MADAGRYYHAEYEAIRVAKSHGAQIQSSAAIAVTLSPCMKGMAKSRIGPPCTQVLKDLGILRVHAGVIDPLYSSEEEYARVGIDLTTTRNPRLARACISLLAVFTKFGNRVNEDIVGVKRELGAGFLLGLSS